MAPKAKPDLSELELRTAILMTGLLQPMSVEQTGSRISVLCRQVPGREQAWLKLMQKLLLEQEALHLCRKYVLKDSKLVFGWHIGLEGRNAAQKKALLRWLVEALPASDAAPPEEVEAPALRAPRKPPVPGTPAQPRVDPDFEHDQEIKMARVRSHTTAEPRVPFYDPNLRLPDPKEKPKLQTVFRGTMKDSRNRQAPYIIEEMPLPHVNVEDMNVPNEKGRGAKGVE